MKLLSVLAVCAALCIAVTQASPQLQEGETDAASLDQLLEMLADQAETESETVDADDIAAVEELFTSRILSRRRQMAAEQCTCVCGGWKTKKAAAVMKNTDKNTDKKFAGAAKISAKDMLQNRRKVEIQCNCCGGW